MRAHLESNHKRLIAGSILALVLILAPRDFAREAPAESGGQLSQQEAAKELDLSRSTHEPGAENGVNQMYMTPNNEFNLLELAPHASPQPRGLPGQAEASRPDSVSGSSSGSTPGSSSAVAPYGGIPPVVNER